MKYSGLSGPDAGLHLLVRLLLRQDAEPVHQFADAQHARDAAVLRAILESEQALHRSRSRDLGQPEATLAQPRPRTASAQWFVC